jgi:hypothetical protein
VCDSLAACHGRTLPRRRPTRRIRRPPTPPDFASRYFPTGRDRNSIGCPHHSEPGCRFIGPGLRSAPARLAPSSLQSVQSTSGPGKAHNGAVVVGAAFVVVVVVGLVWTTYTCVVHPVSANPARISPAIVTLRIGRACQTLGWPATHRALLAEARPRLRNPASLPSWSSHDSMRHRFDPSGHHVPATPLAGAKNQRGSSQLARSCNSPGSTAHRRRVRRH